MPFDKSIFEQELLENTAANLKYWENTSYVADKGIFLTLGCDNLPLKDGARSSVLICRILWAYSIAYNLTQNAHYLDLARIAYLDFKNHYIDFTCGGVFERLNADGTPSDTRKLTYTQSYAVYGLSEYAIASQCEEARHLAEQVSHWIDTHCYCEDHQCYLSDFDREWKDLGGHISIDVHMHLVESHTTLYKLTQNEHTGKRLKHMVNILIDRYLRPSGALYQVLDRSMTQAIDSSDRFGDDAECCWMIAEAAALLEDPVFSAKVHQASLLLAQHILDVGLDKIYGGVYDRHNADGSMNTEKMWWEESESALAMLYAYRISGKEEFAAAAWNIWEFIKNHIITENEWNWRVKDNGTFIPPLDPSDPLKCPYHNTRLTALGIPILRNI